MHKLTIKILGCLLALAVGLQCVDENFTSTTEIDADGDSYAKEVDCDDNNELIYPGAPERVNCIDDSCDGRIDEGTDNEDIDLDGYCPSTGDIGDCNLDKNRHPGMAEDGGDGSQQPNGIDDNCNGLIDDGLPNSDMDDDGYSIKDGDCNDKDAAINPGAMEVAGLACRGPEECPNQRCYDGFCRCQESAECSSMSDCVGDIDCAFPGETCKNLKCVSSFSCHPAQEGMPNPQLKVCRDSTDNDCDNQVDELPESCDKLSELDQNDPYDYARAIGLCDTGRACGVENKCPGNLKCLKGKCTRVLSASFNVDADPRSHALASAFSRNGPFTPRQGESFVILSSGLADYDFSQTCPQEGTAFNNSHPDPDPDAGWDATAIDYVELALEIAVPSNAQSFQFDFHFFSTEYPEWVGSEYNDTFWVNLTSPDLNGNISFDKNGTPIRINNAFFDICDPDPSKPQTASMCSKPSVSLTGTGYAKECVMDSISAGGSTDWLYTLSPVKNPSTPKPPDTIKLVFSIFDKGDPVLDSTVLIDNFRWKLSPAKEPVTGPD